MAARAGTSQPVISAYEHGRRDPTVSTLRRLLRAAGQYLAIDATPLPTAELHRDGRRALSDEQRGAMLADLLVFGEAFPFRRTGELAFPRISSS